MSIAILDLSHPDNGDVRYKHFIFKSGENHFGINNLPKCETVRIKFQFNQDGQILKLLMAVDAIRRINKNIKLDLLIPYFPGARQDRVCNWGESLSVKVYADIINSVGFNSVHVFDPHSEVTPALINNVVVHNNHNFVSRVLQTKSGITDYLTPQFKRLVLISPDAGANKKVLNLGKAFGVEVVRADKLRNTQTGEIVETIVYSDDLTGRAALITDDICSKGGTFKALAKVLKQKNAQKVYLIVSHYEDSADKQSLKDSGIDGIFTTNSIRDVVTDDFLMQFDVFELMKP